MGYSNKYIVYSRKNLMQKTQMRMSRQRSKCVFGAEETAVALAKRYGASPEEASIVASTHDYAKERLDEEFKMVIVGDGFDPELSNYSSAIWHRLVGAPFVKRELRITDSEILHAIRIHTAGAAKMGFLNKIIYVADYTEPDRNSPGVQGTRTIVWIDLDGVVTFETKHMLSHLLAQEQQIYPKTIETYNYWVTRK